MNKKEKKNYCRKNQCEAEIKSKCKYFRSDVIFASQCLFYAQKFCCNSVAKNEKIENQNARIF